MNFYGKYRGKVINTIDPLMLGRLLAIVPAISEMALSWAIPCVPYAGDGVGFFAMPPVGANVWIEFEGGDPNYPIWSGCFWGDGQVPAKPAVPTTFMLKTETAKLEINDLLTTVTLELNTPAGPVKLEESPEGMALTFGTASLKISLQGLTLAIQPSTLTISPESISMKNASASAEVAPAAVSLKNGAASMEMSPASIEIKNGASSVALSPATVSVNNGALEVM